MTPGTIEKKDAYICLKYHRIPMAHQKIIQNMKNIMKIIKLAKK